MKKLAKFILAAAAAALLASCAKKGEETLYLYNWTYYTPQKVIDKFESEFKCKVKLDSYSTCEEMYS